jgi:hypothetical protein
MAHRIPVLVGGQSESVGTIPAPPDAQVQKYAQLTQYEVTGLFELSYGQAISVRFATLADARRWSGFKAKAN